MSFEMVLVVLVILKKLVSDVMKISNGKMVKSLDNVIWLVIVNLLFCDKWLNVFFKME